MAFAELEGGRLNPRDVVGHLLIVWSTDYIEHSPTKYTKPGVPSDAVVVDVVDLDEGDGTLYEGVWWRNSRLIQKLKVRIGDHDPVLAHMAQGTANQGTNAPFVLVSATKDPTCVQRAEDWLARHPDFVPNAPQKRLVTLPSPPVTDAPAPEPPAPAQSRTVSELEALARLQRIAGEGAARLPQPAPETFPY